MKKLVMLTITVSLFFSISSAVFAQTIINPNEQLPLNVDIVSDSIETFSINEGGGYVVVHHPVYKVWPENYYGGVEVKYVKRYSYVEDDTVLQMVIIKKSNPNFTESTKVVPGPQAVEWGDHMEFFKINDEQIKVTHTKKYKVY